MAAFGVSPNRELGQHFLVDDNILGVIGKAAELRQQDAVLEVGGGLGTLSEYLATRVGFLHVVEVDRALSPALEQAVGGFANANIVLGDAVGVDFARLAPAPRKVVANLPYGIAATVILKAFRELEHLELLVAMVQREVADRLWAAPGSRTYGASSVLLQLTCDAVAKRPISRNVFYPVPNVDSALVVLRRTGAFASPETQALVNAAFAHRRKPLAGSVALAPGAGPELRASMRRELELLGHSPSARAEELKPEDFALLSARFDSKLLRGLSPR